MLSEQGISLIEILVSLSLLSLMMLGLDAMQFNAVRRTQAAYYYAVAQNQLNNVVEFLLSTHQVSVSSYLNAWNVQNKLLLPNGKGVISGNDPNYQITIYWGKSLSTECNNILLGNNGCIRIQI